MEDDARRRMSIECVAVAKQLLNGHLTLWSCSQASHVVFFGQKTFCTNNDLSVGSHTVFPEQDFIDQAMKPNEGQLLTTNRIISKMTSRD